MSIRSGLSVDILVDHEWSSAVTLAKTNTIFILITSSSSSSVQRCEWGLVNKLSFRQVRSVGLCVVMCLQRLLSAGLKDSGVSGGRGEERGRSRRSHYLRVQRTRPGQPQFHVHADGQPRYCQGNRHHGNLCFTRSTAGSDDARLCVQTVWINTTHVITQSFTQTIAHLIDGFLCSCVLCCVLFSSESNTTSVTHQWIHSNKKTHINIYWMCCRRLRLVVMKREMFTLCLFYLFAEMDGRLEIGDSQLQGQ